MRIGSARRSDDLEINVVSLIDVLLTLLMFFVLTTTFAQQSGLKVNLPQISAEEGDKQPPAITVMVDREGHFYVGGHAVQGTSVDALKQAIARAAGADRNQMVTLRADAMTAHQNVVIAMDALGQLGFTRLSIATTPAQTETGP